ncbi:MAG: glycoside hydrolase family 78 protein [Prevotella sp.]|nr:glycoside hydrolase family 78 protein [Prevotella sp.]
MQAVCHARSLQRITNLRCENLVNPNAIDNASPHFSWQVLYSGGQMQQRFYEIQVASDSVSLLDNNADLWDSGKVSSSSSVMVRYNGKSLSSRSLSYWRVRIWNDRGEASDWSGVARFGIGIIGDDAMQGSYIGLSSGAGNIQSPLLRQKFSLEKPDIAFLYVNSLGYHEVYINGAKVSRDVLSPAVSHLSKRSLTVTYDVTPYLRTGENELVLWLGTGWYKKTTFGTVYDGPLVKAQLDLLQKGNRNTILTTNASWTGSQTGYSDTGTWQALRFGGERVEGKLVPSDLTPASLDHMKWYPVVEVNVPVHEVSPEMTEPNRIQRTMTPEDIRQLSDSSWLIDMGKALNGWFGIDLPKLPEGHEVLFEYTDYIDKDGVFHDQGQQDIYIAAGNGKEVFCNKFNHHAFRYVRISNLKDKPDRKNVRAYLIHTDYRATSSFECSDPDMNAIHDMIQYTMRCLAFGGYMVDCPHLERAGYGGDGNSSTGSLQIMYDVSPLYTNWLQAWGDVMREGGSLPHVAPNPGAGGGGPYWCGFFVMAPWRTYVNYGDPRLIEKYYDQMKQWLGYVEKYTVEGLLGRWPDTPYRDWFLGDWLAPAGVDSGNKQSIDLVNNCFISECLATMAKIAAVLGKDDEAKEFTGRSKSLNLLIHKTFYNEDMAVYSTGSQLDMSYPMLVGATPEAVYEKSKKQLFVQTEEKYNSHIACGLVGVPILTEWAIENRTADFVYSMLKKRDYPGYLYMIDNGATTTWEYWSGERSRIHNCYNGIGSWFYRAVGGIRTDETNPGYRHVYIEPQIPEGITWAKTSIESPYGKILVDWSLDFDKLNLKITLPVGCKATVIVPDNVRENKLNGKKLKEKKSFEIGNGIHNIEASLLPKTVM